MRECRTRTCGTQCFWQWRICLYLQYAYWEIMHSMVRRELSSHMARMNWHLVGPLGRVNSIGNTLRDECVPSTVLALWSYGGCFEAEQMYVFSKTKTSSIKPWRLFRGCITTYALAAQWTWASSRYCLRSAYYRFFALFSSNFFMNKNNSLFGDYKFYKNLNQILYIVNRHSNSLTATIKRPRIKQ